MKRLWWGVPAIAVLIGVLTAVGILSASGQEEEVQSQNPQVTIQGPFPRLKLEQRLQSAGIQTGVANRVWDQSGVAGYINLRK